MKLLKSTH